MADPVLTPEQWQLFWDMREMFPDVSAKAIKQNIGLGADELAEQILTNKLPRGDQYIVDDSAPPPVTVHHQEPVAVVARPSNIVPYGLINGGAGDDAGPAPAPVRPPRPPPVIRATPVTTPTDTVENRSKKCGICLKEKTKTTYCHFIDADPYDDDTIDPEEHCVCGDCIKKRWMSSRIEKTVDDDSIFCIMPSCSRVFSRDRLLPLFDKPAMVEWLMGSNVSMREASARHQERELKREREEETSLSVREKEHYENIIDYLDHEDFVKVTDLLPDVCFTWILDNIDRGLSALLANKGIATPRMKKRRDKTGVTHLVENRMKRQLTFTCSVCFDEYRSHLAVSCLAAPGAEPNYDAETHSFCAECVQGHAKAATEQNVIVRSGIGIKCMDPSCDNILLRAHVEQVLDAATLATLEELFASEALLAANVKAEKCQRCPFACILEQTPEDHPVFQCRRPQCGFQYCRQCGREWKEEHAGRTCEEFDPEAMRKKMEEKLTEMMRHECPRCRKAFIKIDGCNKITCPCGALSCYVCKRDVTGYDHFSDRNANGKCPLWVDPTAQEKAKADAFLAEQIQRAADGSVAQALQGLK